MGTLLEFPSEASLIARMAEELTARGQLHGEGLRDVALWRRRARAAARSLGRPVQTLAHGDEAWAVLRDWPRDAREQQTHDEQLRHVFAALPNLGEPGGSTRHQR